MKELYEMKGQGRSIRGIARELRISRNSVRKYLRSPGVPKEKRRRRRGSKLDPYTEYIDGRLSDGLENCVVLLRELRVRGYRGGYTILGGVRAAASPPQTASSDDAVRDGTRRAGAGGLGELVVHHRGWAQA